MLLLLLGLIFEIEVLDLHADSTLLLGLLLLVILLVALTLLLTLECGQSLLIALLITLLVSLLEGLSALRNLLGLRLLLGLITLLLRLLLLISLFVTLLLLRLLLISLLPRIRRIMSFGIPRILRPIRWSGQARSRLRILRSPLILRNPIPAVRPPLLLLRWWWRRGLWGWLVLDRRASFPLRLLLSPVAIRSPHFLRGLETSRGATVAPRWSWTALFRLLTEFLLLPTTSHPFLSSSLILLGRHDPSLFVALLGWILDVRRSVVSRVLLRDLLLLAFLDLFSLLLFNGWSPLLERVLRGQQSRIIPVVRYVSPLLSI